MKALYILLLLVCSNFVIAQTQTISYRLTSHNVGIVSTKQDTLYLLDEPIGHQIKNTWYLKDSTGHEKYPVRPYFVFMTKENFVRKLNKQLSLEARKK